MLNMPLKETRKFIAFPAPLAEETDITLDEHG